LRTAHVRNRTKSPGYPPTGACLAHKLLYSVSGTGPNDVWAVGNAGHGLYGRGDALTQHWDGTAWSIVRTPLPSHGAAHVLASVSAVSPTDAWAVGNVGDGEIGVHIILHWDGVVWTQVQLKS
jgi:hypothetical protein